MFSKKTVLFLKYTELPQEIQEAVQNKVAERFANDIYLKLWSEFEPDEGSTWADELTQANIEAYHRDQQETNNFDGTLEEFIDRYGLAIEKWLVDTEVDLTGVEEILIEICW